MRFRVMAKQNPQLQRFICPRCVDPYRTSATDKSHAECEYCGEGMVPMVIWVRRQSRNKGSQGSQKEKP